MSIITAKPEVRRGLFLTTANRIGTTIQNIEKDFWVTWILDLLFNERSKDEPRLLFKGGTSLSKAYSLISRFSEDIDITVFREDIGQNVNIDDLKGLSGKKQRVHLESIKKSCQDYINRILQKNLNTLIMDVFNETGISYIEPPIEPDLNDPDRQTLLFRYPSVSVDFDDYIKPVVKIESGAKSALDPHRFTVIKPYIELDVPDLNLSVQNVVTIDAERTFWDKIVILHGIRRWFDNRGVLRQQGNRISRHYYDIHKMMQSPIGKKALNDHKLATDCAHHAQIFFNSNDLALKHAVPGTISIIPTTEMLEPLQRDYQAMSNMIFGDLPSFSDIIETITNLERLINTK